MQLISSLADSMNIDYRPAHCLDAVAAMLGLDESDLHPSLVNYLDHQINTLTMDGPFYCLYGSDVIEMWNRDMGPGFIIAKHGFLALGHTPCGDAIAVNVYTGAVIEADHERISEDEIWHWEGDESRELPISHANIVATHQTRWQSITDFLQAWKDELQQRDDAEQAFLARSAQDPHATDQFGHTLLNRLARTGKMKSIKKELKRGADPLIENENGRDAFAEAMIMSDFKQLKFWLGKGIDINRQNSKGETYLMMATASSDKKLIKFLLKHGACKDLKNHRGKQAKDLVCVIHGTKAIRKLLK